MCRSTSYQELERYFGTAGPPDTVLGLTTSTIRQSGLETPQGEALARTWRDKTQHRAYDQGGAKKGAALLAGCERQNGSHGCVTGR
eukprot:5102549-Amphidinium_carterae.2